MHDHHHGDDCGCGHDHKPEAPADDQATGPKCVSEFVSRNQNYKAAVYDLESDPEKFEVAIYKWNEEKEDVPVWERIAGPIIMDTLPAAETWGQQNLAVYAGEKLDTKASDSLRNDVFEALGNDNFDFLDPLSFEVSFLESEDSEEFLPLPNVEQVLVAGEFYFVSFKGAWLAGFLYDEGQIRCWKRFDDLKAALVEIV